MTAVLDASALLAFLQDEVGADQVEAALHGDARRLGATAWTADTSWGSSETVRQIR